MKKLTIAILLSVVTLLTSCVIKHNTGVVSDGKGGVLRIYFIEGNTTRETKFGATGLEHCKVEGSEVKCVDLKINVPW